MSQPQPPGQPYGTAAPTTYGAATYGSPRGWDSAPQSSARPAPDPQPAYVPGHHGPVPEPQFPPPQANFAGQYAPSPAAGQLAITACRMCGSVPAVKTRFRGHQGMIVLMRFLSTDGPFCRDCGLGTFRHMTSRTLLQGWYGYGSTVITPITVLVNIARRGKVARLAPPQPNPYGPSRPPMSPGPRLLQRPMTWAGLAIPFLVIGLFVAANVFS